MRKGYETEYVPTNTLRVGDLIIAHGGLFRVFEVKVGYPRKDDKIDERGECHVNRCEFLGDAHPDYPCQIPVAWRDGSPDPGNPGRTNHWNQQGNGLARTTRVLRITENGRTVWPGEAPHDSLAYVNATDEGEGPPPGDAYWEGESYDDEPEPEDNCAHEWNYTGTNYGGDDERWHGEGRVICRLCGADGDA